MFRAVLLAVVLQMATCASVSIPDELMQPPAPGQLQQGNASTVKNEQTAFQAIEQANYAVGNLRMTDRNGLVLHEGDIKLTHRQRKVLKKESTGGRQKRGAMRSLARRWMDSNGRPLIPYYIEGSVAHARRVIDAAIRHWMNKVPCLRFVPRTSHRNYISFFYGGGCYSMVGRVGGGQKISIGRGCDHIGVVVHEIGHALGFWHEQSRPDRDRYINIHWNNIPNGARRQFSKMSSSSINSRGVPYDYDSVMHYHSTAFGNGRITITRKDGSTKLGNTRGLSPKDIQQANLMYCNGQPTSRPVTPKPPTGCQFKDYYPNCPSWKSRGFCRSGRWQMFMRQYCKKSCFCKNNCRDLHRNCPSWKQRGYCQRSSRHYAYMSTNCKNSCGFC